MLYVALGATGLGLAYLLLRKATAKPASPCDQLTGDAKTACQVASGVIGGLTAIGDALVTSDKEWGQRDTENAALNGGVDVKLESALRDRMWLQSGGNDPHTQSWQPWFAPTVTALKFKNGCVPIKGSPGWLNCAPGTHDIAKDDPEDPRPEAAGGRKSSDPFEPFTDGYKATNRAGFMTGGDTDAATQNLPGGVSYVAGKKYSCAKGVIITRDHRPGHEGEVSAECAGAAPPVDTSLGHWEWKASPAPGKWVWILGGASPPTTGGGTSTGGGVGVGIDFDFSTVKVIGVTP